MPKSTARGFEPSERRPVGRMRRLEAAGSERGGPEGGGMDAAARRANPCLSERNYRVLESALISPNGAVTERLKVCAWKAYVP